MLKAAVYVFDIVKSPAVKSSVDKPQMRVHGKDGQSMVFW